MAKSKPPTHDGNLTLQQRAQIVKYASQLPAAEKTLTHIADWAFKTFNTRTRPHSSTIGRILKRKDEYNMLIPHEHNRKRRRAVKNSTLETMLRDWIIMNEKRKVRLSTALIKIKAREFAQTLDCAENFKFSNGWYQFFAKFFNKRYQCFAKRNGFKEFKIHGESGDAQMEGIEEKIAEIKANRFIFLE